MAQSTIHGVSIRGLTTAVPSTVFNNLTDATRFPKEEVRKVAALAGVTQRRVTDEASCSTDLCLDAANALLQDLAWSPESIDALIMVTQTPDYFMPSSSCVMHHKLGLSTDCAAFDLGLGCSGYIYGLWLAAMMLKSGGLHRVLLLHGETPTRYAGRDDRAVALLFGDAGSATAIERDDSAPPWYFRLHTDGSGYQDLLIDAGGFRDRFSPDSSAHFVRMNGANIFNFSITAIPPLVEDTLRLAGEERDQIDYFVFHQSNKFILDHLIGSCRLEPRKVPTILGRFGNTGGPSVPLTIVEGLSDVAGTRTLKLMLLGYGAGLSWGAALVTLPSGVRVRNVERKTRGSSNVTEQRAPQTEGV